MGAVVLYIETSAAVTKPSGWVEATGSPLIANETGGSGRMRWFYSVAPLLTGTWDFSWTGAAWRSAGGILISGRTGAGNPFGTGSTIENVGSSTFTLPAVTVATTGDGVLVFATSNATHDITNSAGVTERYDADEVYIGMIDNATAGSTGTKLFSNSASSDHHAWMAPIPASVGGTDATVTFPQSIRIHP
jgi:hypothetical protein